MSTWPQDIGSKKGSYERPNQNWICGRACLGDPCLVGPDEHGRCRATCECRPLRKGDRWICTRPETGGGPCAEGPRPDGSCNRPIPKCEPVRSLRSWRGLVSLLTVCLSLSFLALEFTRDKERSFVSPGELNFAHSSFDSKCSDCHQKAVGSPFFWFQRSDVSAPKSNTRLCLNCHHFGDHPAQPHGLPPAEQVALRSRLQQASNSGKAPLPLLLSSMLARDANAAGTDLSCAACHREHQGKNHDLKKLSDLQCQGCHAVQFASFTGGHPPFTDYPFTRRTRIVFDHSSHFRTHFQDEKFKPNALGSCTDCHVPDDGGKTMLVKSFEQVCAACHADQIGGKGRAGALGIPFLRLPGLDVQTLNGRGFGVGEWPEFAEDKATPFMELLFAIEPDALAGSEKLSKVDLTDLSKADDATLKAAHQFAWTIKGLLFDLTTKGQPELSRRIQAALISSLAPQETEALIGGLSAEVINSAAVKWLPNLEKEVAQFRSGAKVVAPERNSSAPAKTADDSNKQVKPEAWVQSGGWYHSEREYSVFYRPTGHQDGCLTAWLNLAANPARQRYTNVAERILLELAAPKSVGLCVKCHSLDDHPLPHVNWQGTRPDATHRRSTFFSHAAHFSVLDARGCLMCHELEPKGSESLYLAAFDKNNRRPGVFHSNFQPIDKSICASCHNARSARDNCLNCHNYHVGHFTRTLSEKTVSKTR